MPGSIPKYKVGDVLNGFLLVEFSRYKRQTRFFKVKCKYCENIFETRPSDLVSGHTGSCGCKTREFLSEANITHGHAINYRSSPEYQVWSAMIERCRNPKCKYYENYGGRGIKVCDRWLDFNNFITDVGLRPSPKHTLDRFPNMDGDYELSNFRWATMKQQQNNKRNNLKITYNGRTQTLMGWKEELGLKLAYNTLRDRLTKGWSVEKTFETPSQRNKNRRKVGSNFIPYAFGVVNVA
jgi:hypothetical protein